MELDAALHYERRDQCQNEEAYDRLCFLLDEQITEIFGLLCILLTRIEGMSAHVVCYFLHAPIHG